jgi:CelD/BcsL family acetyltransferase involved in cellulose biosynthesis
MKSGVKVKRADAPAQSGPWLTAACSLTAAAVSTQIIQDLAGLERLAEAWDSLALAFAFPTQQYIWARACAEAFAADRRLQIVTVEAGGQTLALAPLVKRGARLEMLGVRELCEPMDFLYGEAAQITPLAEALAGLGVVLTLGRVPVDSPAVGALCQSYGRRGWVHLAPVAACPYIKLTADWREPERQFNAGRRSDFRRATRRAQRMGAASYEVRTPAPAELAPLLQEAYAVEQASWKGASNSALALDSVRGDFFRRYAAAACAKGILRLCFLRIGGQAAAMQIAVECAGRFWLLKIGYDERFARCSPGALLLLHTVQYAARQGLEFYELLGAAEPWTQHWTPLSRTCVSLRAYPYHWRGLAALTGDAAQFVWKRLSNKQTAQN